LLSKDESELNHIEQKLKAKNEKRLTKSLDARLQEKGAGGHSVGKTPI